MGEILAGSEVGTESLAARGAFPLFELSVNQKTEVADIVASLDGKADVLIHPFFDLHEVSGRWFHGRVSLEPAQIILAAAGEASLTLAQRRIIDINQTQIGKKHDVVFCHWLRFKRNGKATPGFAGYAKALTKVLRKGKLLLLAEKSRNVDRSLLSLRNLGFHGRVVYYCTENESSQPLNRKSDSLEEVAEVLRELNVKHLFVGGQYLIFSNLMRSCGRGPYQIINGVKTREDLGSGSCCVGSFINKICRHGIDCTASTASFPGTYRAT